jgi:two-component system alkaline phosphatase synthesis response regulator PhoP
METVKTSIYPTLLAVDADSAFLAALKTQLRKTGFRVHTSATLSGANSILGEQFINLLLVNASVGGECAIRFVEGMRRIGKRVPTIFTLDRSGDGNRLRALEVGDDVIAKPLLFNELVARIRAVLRRAETVYDWHVAENVTLKDGDFSFCGATVSPRRMMIFFANGGQDSLGGKELGLMRCLDSRAGEVVTRRELINSVWGPQGSPRSRSLDQYLVRLRKLFRRNGQREIEWVETHHGIGFRYLPHSADTSAPGEMKSRSSGAALGRRRAGWMVRVLRDEEKKWWPLGLAKGISDGTMTPQE